MRNERNPQPYLKVSKGVYKHSLLVWCDGSLHTSIEDFPYTLLYGNVLFYSLSIEIVRIHVNEIVSILCLVNQLIILSPNRAENSLDISSK